MSTTTQPRPLSPPAKRLGTGEHPGPRRRRSHVGAEEPSVTEVMGPANHAPGVPIMGAPGGSLHPVMGGADEGPRTSVMGAGDHGIPIDVFGESDPRFVDSLFAGPLRPPSAS